MPSSPIDPQRTDFSIDVFGRYICNGMDEVRRDGADPFDIIVIGGGSFGPILAAHAFNAANVTPRPRILVLEAGPYLLPEHLQNLPEKFVDSVWNNPANPNVQRDRVWGLPWRSKQPSIDNFPGIPFCLGGRSLYFGGWSPELLESETRTWPADLLADLRRRSDTQPGYFQQASEQIGTNVTNDYIRGPFHETLRQQLFETLDQIPNVYALAELPQHLDQAQIDATPPEKREQLKLEAPLAVQGAGPRAGLGAINKFSSVPMLTAAARRAWRESLPPTASADGLFYGDDKKKRLMIVPNCRVARLITARDGDMWRVTEIVAQDSRTNEKFPNLPVPNNCAVVIALGTIESTRMALLSFSEIPNYNLIVTNFIEHLRSNTTINVPISALKNLPPGALDGRQSRQSALFLKGKADLGDGKIGHFHLQITASAEGAGGTDTELELFKRIPDIDLLHAMEQVPRDHVAITLRGIGETQPHNPANRISLASGQPRDEADVERAFVEIASADPAKSPPSSADTPQTILDRKLWAMMDETTRSLAMKFGESAPNTIRDPMGSTHHEAGPLWMGTDAKSSVTNPDGRFHYVANAYVAGPALFPTVGSPNPMLTGTALARRTADVIVRNLSQPPLPIERDFVPLFDGTDASFRKWMIAGFRPPGPSIMPAGGFGPAYFRLIDENIVASATEPYGIFYFGDEVFSDFILRMQFRLSASDNNSGVFLRFRDPQLHWPDLEENGPTHAPLANRARIAEFSGFEVQIDEQATPDGQDKHRTGAIYNVDVGSAPGQQTYTRAAPLVAGRWNFYEIEVRGATYVVRLNGRRTAVFTNLDLNRGQPATQNPNSGFIGIQGHSGEAAFRNIRIKRL
jgi:choline dehydrogenase-like flavoprotein